MVEQWVSLGNVEFDKLMIRQYVVGYAFPKEPGKPDMAAIGAAAEKMKPQVAVLDRAVAEPGYLAGDGFTLADINILPMLFYVNRFEEGKAILAGEEPLGLRGAPLRPESFPKSAPRCLGKSPGLPFPFLSPSRSRERCCGFGRRSFLAETRLPHRLAERSERKGAPWHPALGRGPCGASIVHLLYRVLPARPRRPKSLK